MAILRLGSGCGSTRKLGAVADVVGTDPTVGRIGLTAAYSDERLIIPLYKSLVRPHL